MIRKQETKLGSGEYGFTLLEAALAVIIIGIVAMMTVPRIVSTDKHVVKSTAHQIIADMRYARGLAIAKAASYIVRFHCYGNPWYLNYEILDASNNEVKSMVISDKIICKQPGGFDGNPYFDITFSKLGSASPSPGNHILSLSTGDNTYTKFINIINATGRVEVEK